MQLYTGKHSAILVQKSVNFSQQFRCKMTEYDSGIGVSVVLVSFFALILFFVKWKPAFSPYKPTSDDVPEVPMVGIQLPFTIQITDADNASFTDGIKVRLKSDHACVLQTFWGVECSSLQQILQRNPLQLIQQANIVLEGNYLAHNDQASFPEGSDDELLVRLPEGISELSLGAPPRSRYPLCLIIKSREALISQTEMSIIGSIMLIHIPDTNLHEKCHIISHLLVTNKGQAHDLQTLYMASEEQNDLPSTLIQPSNKRTHSDTEPRAEESTQSETQPSTSNSTQPTTSNSTDIPEGVPRDCTVCQNAPISRVILPCRHACICDSCFPLVNRCPMCRGVIYSFFSMGTGYQHDLLNRNNEDKDWMDKIEDGCERLNQWLGFNH